MACNADPAALGSTTCKSRSRQQSTERPVAAPPPGWPSISARFIGLPSDALKRKQKFRVKHIAARAAFRVQVEEATFGQLHLVVAQQLRQPDASELHLDLNRKLCCWGFVQPAVP